MTVAGCYVLAKNETPNIGRTVASALALGIPVTVLDSGSSDGTPELARKAGATVEAYSYRGHGGVAAEYFSTSDPVACAAAVRRLTEDPGLRLRMRVEALRRAAAFTWERHVDSVMEAFGRHGP